MVLSPPRSVAYEAGVIWQRPLRRGLVLVAGLGVLLAGCPSKKPSPPPLSWRLYHCGGEECILVAVFTQEWACHDYEQLYWSQCDPDAARNGSLRCDLVKRPNFPYYTRCTRSHLVWNDVKDGPQWSF